MVSMTQIKVDNKLTASFPNRHLLSVRKWIKYSKCKEKLFLCKFLQARMSLQQKNYCRKKKKENLWIGDFAVSADHRVKIKENEKRDKYLPEILKVMEHESDGDIYYLWGNE